LNLEPGATNKKVKTVIATFAASPQLSSLFLFCSEASLLGDETNDTRSTKLPILWAVLAGRDLERKESNSSNRERSRQTSKKVRKARGNKVSPLQWNQDLEELQVFHCQRRRLATLFMPRLRISIYSAINHALKISFFLYRRFFEIKEMRF